MIKRKHSRFIRRLETEFSGEGKNYRAISSDFSCEGLFIRTNHAFPPGTEIAITVHLPDGNISSLKGLVCRALKTTVVSLKNGMGIELIEKDRHYIEFMKIFTKECDRETEKSGPASGPAPTPPAPEKPPETSVPEFMIISCAACGVKNKVRTERFAHGPKCGKCGSPLSVI